MAEIETEVKKWGNSLGVRLPRDLLTGEGIREGDRVHLTVEKAALAPDPEFFGLAKKYKKRSSQTYEQFKAKEKRQQRAHERRLELR